MTAPLAEERAGAVRTFHASLPGYAPTPLLELGGLAAQLGLGGILIKVEASRFGLPAFKILGASWATYRAVAEQLGIDVEASPISLRSLRDAAGGQLTLITATDGNHGRAV